VSVAARAVAALALAAFGLACETPPPPPQEKVVVVGAASASASIPPSPLATQGTPQVARDPDAGIGADDALAQPAADPMVPAEPLPVDTPAAQDLAGVTLQATWRWRDVPAPPKAPEVVADAIARAAKLTALTWQIDLTENGRMRIVFTSRALPVPTYSEIRARADRVGSALVWPNAVAYRVVPPGALRPLIGERRVDVTPLTPGVAKPAGDGKRFGFAFRRVEITSALGAIKIELAKIPEAEAGGPLFCRALVEIAGVDPRTPVCQPGEVALGASYTWADGGGVALEVTSVTKRADLAPNDVLCPPPQASFQATGVPPVGDGIFLTKDELAAFRSGPLNLPPVTAPGAPGEGFIAVNRADYLVYLLLDGVPVVAVPPGGEPYVIGPMRGRYVAEWRTFLGEKVEPARVVEMPTRLVFGAPPPSAPDAGVAPKASASAPIK
jgi:hypothetical protein